MVMTVMEKDGKGHTGYALATCFFPNFQPQPVFLTKPSLFPRGKDQGGTVSAKEATDFDQVQILKRSSERSSCGLLESNLY